MSESEKIIELMSELYGEEDKREWIEERAAIMQYDGGLSREEAERRAEEEYCRIHTPQA